MKRLVREGDALIGKVRIAPRKAMKMIITLTVSLYAMYYYGITKIVLLNFFISCATMYIGVIAYHRLIIHRSFKCPIWLEYMLIFIANFSGMGSPITLIKFHDL